MEWDPKAAGQLLQQKLPVANDGAGESEVRRGVRPQPTGSFGQAPEREHGAVLERMSDLGLGLDPPEPMARERKPEEEGRASTQRVDGAADVVHKSRERQLGRAAAATHRFGSLEELNLETGLCQSDRGRETVGSGTHHHGIEPPGHRPPPRSISNRATSGGAILFPIILVCSGPCFPDRCPVSRATAIKGIMALFSPRANTLFRAALFALGGVSVLLLAALLLWPHTPTATGQYAPIAQPVAFDHLLHTRAFDIDCRYCHASVERSATAGMPSTSTCIPCHKSVWLSSRMMAPVLQSMATHRPIPWQRVNSLPDFVYFNHAIHVNKGVGCETCHGRVDGMSRIYQTAPLTMNWCLDCHRSPERHLRPVEQMTTMGWIPNGAQLAIGRELKRRYEVRELLTCTTCHR